MLNNTDLKELGQIGNSWPLPQKHNKPVIEHVPMGKTRFALFMESDRISMQDIINNSRSNIRSLESEADLDMEMPEIDDDRFVLGW